MLKPSLGFEQEEMSQDDQSHMMMPAEPTAELIIAHTKRLFSILKASFDGPAQAAEADEFWQRGDIRRV